MSRPRAKRKDRGVAITGMSCLFPGAPDVDTYWHNILAKVDATSDPPPEAWDPDVYYDPEFKDTDRTYCKRGGYLGALAAFEPLAYGIPPVSVGGEPDQWLALKVAHEALADAGATELPDAIRQRTAIVLGKGTYLNGGNAIALQRGLVVGQTIELIRQLRPDYSEDELEQLRTELQGVLPPLGPDTVAGLIPNIIVGRIANRLDLMGPAYTVDAACASSLVAVRHAVRDLLAGDCDLALAGGSQVWMPVATLNLFCRLGALSRRQQLRAFDADADGTLLGEGIGMVVLKRLDDAVRDGDRVYAVIRGIGVASDGRGVSVMAPRVDGEELALRRAYEDAGVSPRSVGLMEAHGTGTPVGDVTEVQALTRVFGGRDGELPHCALGTVKSMIGHTIPAAGVAGLIKTALALHHRVLPPTLNCEQPNPALELDRTPFYINTETRPWIHGGSEPRRAGVNAFGFGGINAHAVLEEFDGAAATDHRPPWDSELCILEGDSAEALAEAAAELETALEGKPDFELTDLAFTLSRALGATSQAQRLAIVASSMDDLRRKLGQAREKLRDGRCRRIKMQSGIYYEAEPLGRDGKIVFVFPGEGAQYPNMLADLCLQFSEARAVFDRIDRLYVDHPRGHVLSDWVYPRPAFSEQERRRIEERLMELDIAVESVLTANAAALAVVGRLVTRVDAMLGHSTGEHSAAMATGALDLETDERLARFCHGLNASYADAASRHEVPGAVLLAIGADAAGVQRIAAQAGGELHLAMDNCPHQAVLVGEAEAVGRARELAVGEGLMCEQLPYDRAVHTPLFAPFAEDLRTVFADLPVRRPATALWSCTTARPCPDDPAEIRELLAEHWTSPVRFRETIEALHSEGARVFVETGPRGNMTAFIEDILRGRPACAVATDLRRRSGVTQLNHLAASLAVHDVPLDLGYLFRQRSANTIEWRRGGHLPAKAVGPKIPLSTTWPMLRLSTAALRRLSAEATPPHVAANGHAADPPRRVQAALASAQPASPRPPEPAPDGAPRTALGPPGAAMPDAPGAVTVPVAVATATAPPPSAASRDSDATAYAVDQHLQTMERFLQTGEEVMRAYLTAELLVASEGTIPGEAPVVGAQAVVEEGVREQPRRPLVGTVLTHEPGAELLARRLVDPATDRYLLHHTLGGTVSRCDPELPALALMPLAMSIEILAEAASSLAPERVVTGLRDVRAHRWLSFDERAQVLEVSARRLAPGEGCERFLVELREETTGAATSPAVQAIVMLSDHYPVPPIVREAGLEDARPSRLAAGRLYGEAMFHQPMWQGVRSIEAVAPTGALARLQVLPRAGLLKGVREPEFALDPVMLDAAGQVVGFWAAECLENARVVFPFRVRALDLYGPPRAPGEVLTCRAAVGLEGGQLVRSDIDVYDDHGRCHMRLAGWEDKRFDVPERFRPLTSPIELAPLSTPWPCPAVSDRDRAVACRRLEAHLPADQSLWKQVWARRILGRRERQAFDALNLPEGRQLEWLGARTAAKEAVAELLRPYGVDLLHADIEILPDERGRPIVEVAGLEETGVVPLVSLAHTQGQAVACVTLVPRGSEAGIGIDVEQLVARPAGFAEAALTAGERRLLEPLPPGAADEWLLRCWCAREAAGKSVGSGLSRMPAAPTVAAIDIAHETVMVDVERRRLSVHTRREQDLIVATTLWEET